MSLTIRLSRIGRKNQPAYKLVVANTKDKRNGRSLEVLGYFNPFDPVKKFSYDKEKFEKWEKEGAFVTDAVKKLIDGKYEYIKYDPKKAKAEAEEAKKAATEAPEIKEALAEEDKPKETSETEEKVEGTSAEEKVKEETALEEPKEKEGAGETSETEENPSEEKLEEPAPEEPKEE